MFAFETPINASKSDFDCSAKTSSFYKSLQVLKGAGISVIIRQKSTKEFPIVRTVKAPSQQDKFNVQTRLHAPSAPHNLKLGYDPVQLEREQHVHCFALMLRLRRRLCSSSVSWSLIDCFPREPCRGRSCFAARSQSLFVDPRWMVILQPKRRNWAFLASL